MAEIAPEVGNGWATHGPEMAAKCLAVRSGESARLAGETRNRRNPPEPPASTRNEGVPGSSPGVGLGKPCGNEAVMTLACGIKPS